MRLHIILVCISYIYIFKMMYGSRQKQLSGVECLGYGCKHVLSSLYVGHTFDPVIKDARCLGYDKVFASHGLPAVGSDCVD